MSLPADIPAKIAACLASGDKEAARSLAGAIAGAMAKGEAYGFDGELAALRKLAGTDKPLGKLAKGALAKGVDTVDTLGDLRARADVVVRALERAETPMEKATAERDGKALLDEINARKAIGAVHAGAVKKVAAGELMGFLR